MKKLLTLILCLVGMLWLGIDEAKAQTQTKEGIASYYHNKFNGRKTANGEIFTNSEYTAASNHFPLGSYVKVTNKRNGHFVYVKINDRMGHSGRIIDLTERAASDLNFKQRGLTQVKVELVSPEEGQRKILAQRQGGSEKKSNTL